MVLLVSSLGSFFASVSADGNFSKKGSSSSQGLPHARQCVGVCVCAWGGGVRVRETEEEK